MQRPPRVFSPFRLDEFKFLLDLPACGFVDFVYNFREQFFVIHPEFHIRSTSAVSIQIGRNRNREHLFSAARHSCHEARFVLHVSDPRDPHIHLLPVSRIFDSRGCIRWRHRSSADYDDSLRHPFGYTQCFRTDSYLKPDVHEAITRNLPSRISRALLLKFSDIKCYL